MPVPEVQHAEFTKALKPLMSLIGLDVNDLYAEGFHVTAESIEGLLVERPEGAADEDAAEVGDGPAAAIAWPFAVAVKL